MCAGSPPSAVKYILTIQLFFSADWADSFISLFEASGSVAGKYIEKPLNIYRLIEKS